MTTTITDTTRLTVVKLLAGGRDIGFAAAATSLTEEATRQIAQDHGYPDTSKLRWAVDVLTKKLDSANAIPVRPAAAHPRDRAARAAGGAPLALRDDQPGGETLDGRYQSVLVRDLVPDPDNPREDLGDLRDLAESMRSAGLLQPIVARRHLADHGPVLYVVAGHRRLGAAKLLGWSKVPTIIRRDMAPDRVLAAMLIENGQRAGLDPIEEARAMARLRGEHGITSHGDLARLIGRTQVHVSGRLALLSLTVEEQDQIRAGDMNVADGIARGRLNAGTVRAKGTTGHPHLGVDHDLASKAGARCKRLNHKRSGRNSVGGVACGACWESVIRADEREHLHTLSGERRECVICSAPVDTSEQTA